METGCAEGKGKPDRTSLRYGMKLFHHGTRHRHGMSTHPWRVRTDPNLPIRTTLVCAVCVPLPCRNCRLYIPIGTRTVSLSTDTKCPVQLGKWLELKQLLQWNAWLDNRLPIADDTTMHTEMPVQCPNWSRKSESELLILSNLELTFCNES